MGKMPMPPIQRSRSGTLNGLKRPRHLNILLLVALVPYLICTGIVWWTTIARNKAQNQSALTLQNTQRSLAVARYVQANAHQALAADIARSTAMITEINRLVAKRALTAGLNSASDTHDVDDAIDTKIAACHRLQQSEQDDQARATTADAEFNRLMAQQAADSAALLAASNAGSWKTSFRKYSSLSMLPYLAAILWTVVWQRRRQGREKNNCCLACGYSLRGNISGVCPECGKAVASEAAPLPPLILRT
jgi:hypothetical protein